MMPRDLLQFLEKGDRTLEMLGGEKPDGDKPTGLRAETIRAAIRHLDQIDAMRLAVDDTVPWRLGWHGGSLSGVSFDEGRP